MSKRTAITVVAAVIAGARVGYVLWSSGAGILSVMATASERAVVVADGVQAHSNRAAHVR